MKIQHAMKLLAITLAIATTACTHVSRNISDDGKAGDVVFPAVEDIVLKEGTYPTVEALRQIGPGVSKDQLYQLLGRPHFNEGLIGVREWDYLFHFRKGDEVVTCQYKVIFDKQYHGQSFHWAPATCADLLAGGRAGSGRQFDLSGDALFEFARYGVADVLPDGRKQVEAIALQLKDARFSSIQVIGYTDRIGDELSNLKLSQRRADTIRELLVEAGMHANAVIALGRGETGPVKTCADSLGQPALIACLQPNRRVEIIARGQKKVDDTY